MEVLFKMAFFCNCKDEIAEIKRVIKAMQADVETLEIKALEAKRSYAKKLKQLDNKEKEETQSINNPVILPYDGSF